MNLAVSTTKLFIGGTLVDADIYAITTENGSNRMVTIYSIYPTSESSHIVSKLQTIDAPTNDDGWGREIAIYNNFLVIVTTSTSTYSVKTTIYWKENDLPTTPYKVSETLSSYYGGNEVTMANNMLLVKGYYTYYYYLNTTNGELGDRQYTSFNNHPKVKEWPIKKNVITMSLSSSSIKVRIIGTTYVSSSSYYAGSGYTIHDFDYLPGPGLVVYTSNDYQQRVTFVTYCYPNASTTSKFNGPNYCDACNPGRYSNGGDISSCNYCDSPYHSHFEKKPGCFWSCNKGYFGDQCVTCTQFSQGKYLPPDAHWVNGKSTCYYKCNYGVDANTNECLPFHLTKTLIFLIVFGGIGIISGVALFAFCIVRTSRARRRAILMNERSPLIFHVVDYEQEKNDNDIFVDDNNNNNNNNNNQTIQNPQQQTIREEDLCIICMDRVKQVVAVPCGHCFACQPCSTLMKNSNKPCAFCRTPVQQYIKYYK